MADAIYRCFGAWWPLAVTANLFGGIALTGVFRIAARRRSGNSGETMADDGRWPLGLNVQEHPL